MRKEKKIDILRKYKHILRTTSVRAHGHDKQVTMSTACWLFLFLVLDLVCVDNTWKNKFKQKI